MVRRSGMWYITYDINTRTIVRADSNEILVQDENLKTLKVEDATDDFLNKLSAYKVDDNGKFYVDEDLVKEYNLNILRDKREPLLKAFDIYKSNLIIGAISLPEEQKQEVITWYNLILDLDADAINNPPEVLSKYIQ